MSKHYYDFDTAYLSSSTGIGGMGGKNYYFGIPKRGPLKSGTVVRSIKAWKNDYTLKALEVELSDGSVHSAGHKEGEQSDPFFFAQGEKLTSLKLWGGDSAGGRATGIELHTDDKRSFNFTVRDHMKTSYEPDLGSGILVGVFGRSDHDIDCLGFGMLQRVRSVKLVDVDYPDINDDTKITTRPELVDSADYNNLKNSTEETVRFSGTKSVAITKAWSWSAGIEAGVSTTISGGIPLLGEASVTASLSVSASATHENSSTESMEQTYELSITVPPYTRIKASAILFKGVVNQKYKGRIECVLETGKKFSYGVSGTYNGVAASKVIIKTEELK